MNGLGEFIEAFKEGMASFGTLFAAVVNFILMSIAYFLGIGATAIAAKLSGKRFLETRILPDEKSYWTGLKLKSGDMEGSRRQY